MKRVIIIRYAEMFLKGKNRGFFEGKFESNLQASLKGIAHKFVKQSGRYLIEDFAEEETEEIVERLKKVFGAHTISVAYETASDLDSIFEVAKLLLKPSGTFKVESHRGDKKYPMTSVEISRELGAMILDYAKGKLSVDVHNPSFTVRVDIRDFGRALVFGDFIEGANGMPVGTAGKGVLLLSGGIDSPVAGHMMAKRGMVVECLHFHSYPYTNMQAKEKVIDLAKILSQYTGVKRVHSISVTQIQEEIHQNCKDEYMITLLRRFMYRLAEWFARKIGGQCLITGESLGQVASQTIEGVTSSNSVVEKLPVLRPLIGFDKNEIIERSYKIGSYETSILPYEDCCTVFLPEHPVTRPKMEDILREERKLDLETLLQNAMDTLEVTEIE